MHHAFAHPLLLAGAVGLAGAERAGLVRRPPPAARLAALGGLAATAVLLRRRPSRLRGLVLWLGLVCLALGMAGPRWGRDWSQSAAPGRDLVVVVDLSRSMFAEAPSRSSGPAPPCSISLRPCTGAAGIAWGWSSSPAGPGWSAR